MNQKTLMAIVGVVIVAFAVQTYMLFRLHDQVNQLTDDKTVSLELPLKMPKPLLPKPGANQLPDSWNPYAEMERMQHEMEQVFEDSFSRMHMNNPSGRLTKTPEVDVQEASDRYIVTVNIPGADVSTLDVKVDDDVLTISVKTEKKFEQSESHDQFKRRERFVGQFQRSMTLPGPVDPAGMSTDYKNGVLTIIIPKA
jgi:HSP20 family protein